MVWKMYICSKWDDEEKPMSARRWQMTQTWSTLPAIIEFYDVGASRVSFSIKPNETQTVAVSYHRTSIWRYFFIKVYEENSANLSNVMSDESRPHFPHEVIPYRPVTPAVRQVKFAYFPLSSPQNSARTVMNGFGSFIFLFSHLNWPMQKTAWASFLNVWNKNSKILSTLKNWWCRTALVTLNWSIYWHSVMVRRI